MIARNGALRRIRALRSTPVVRLAGELVRLAVIVLFFVTLVTTVTGSRADLLRPTTFGSDTWNYEAAAERLVAHDHLYSLSAGDRPVPQDNPPWWHGAILSPPAMAAAWVPFLVLPDGARELAWWALHLALVVGVAVFLLASAPALGVLLAIPLVQLSGSETWTGNINGFLLAIAVAFWWSRVGEHGRWGRWGRRAAEIAVGVGAAVKFTPAALVGVLLRERAWRSIAVVGVTALAVTAVSVVLTGRHNTLQYFAVASQIAPSPGSLTRLAQGFGVPRDVARLVPYLVWGLGTLAAAVVPSRKVSFAIAWATAVISTPVLRLSSLSLLVGCLAPWVRGVPRLRWRAGLATAIAASTTAAAIAASVATGGLQTSSLAIDNRSTDGVIVRFPARAQTASVAVSVPGQTEGVVWRGLTTVVEFPLFVFDARCRLMAAVRLPPSGGTITIAPDGEVKASNEVAQTTADLGYSRRCDTALRRVISVDVRPLVTPATSAPPDARAGR